jgi:hypothetical protein
MKTNFGHVLVPDFLSKSLKYFPKKKNTGSKLNGWVLPRYAAEQLCAYVNVILHGCGITPRHVVRCSQPFTQTGETRLAAGRAI